MKDWEKYEEQIFEKLRTEFPDADIKKNQKIVGKYSERSRQIDILIKSKSIGRELLVAVDCKKFSEKINVKTVESFIGFTEDIGAHVGIMITNKGYSKSALKRVTNKYHRDIQLDIVEFSYLDDYHFSWDDCHLCKNDDGFPRGRIMWEDPLSLVKEGVLTIINKGDCSYCGELYVKCQGCGEIMHFEVDQEDIECQCGNVFSIQSEYIGSGMNEYHIYIKDQKSEPKEFIDPNQIGLFD